MTNKRILEQLYNASQIGTTSKENEKVLKDYYKVVLRDLNRLEKLEKENKELRKSIKSWNENVGNLLKENTKLKKAIEIIKEKKVDIPKLLANDFNNYNALAVFFGFKQLTQEEYELLKEVL